METTEWPASPASPASKHRPSGRPHDLHPEVSRTEDATGITDLGEHDVDHVLTPVEVETPGKGWMIVGAFGVVGILAALLLVGSSSRERVDKQIDAQAEAALSGPILVNTVLPTRAPAIVNISMPANLRPWQETSLFARTTGYLKKFVVDINDQVKAGQLMAIIDAPEVDQQLNQARAALQQTKAAVFKAESDENLASVTFKRYDELAASHSVTAQDLDTAKANMVADQANVEAAKANVGAAEANVQRLEQLVSFEKVTAPFSGVVTGRTFDVGALITADPTTTDIKPMFKIAENDVLRVFVNVPQSSALEIRKGMQVKVTSREVPGRIFTGTVMGTTNYLDQMNRSLLTEVKVLNAPNADGDFALLPGMYVMVDFEVHRNKPPLIVPAPALIDNTDGTQLATVRDGKIHFVKVVLGEDFGKTIEIVEGLKGDEQIIATPGERVVEGAPVQVTTNHSD